MHPAVSRVTKYMYSRAYHRVLHICRRFHADSLEYVYYCVFKRVLMLYHSLIHQECISENTAVYLDVLQRIQWKLCNTPNTLSIHNWYIVFHYLDAAGGTGSRIRPGYVNTQHKYVANTRQIHVSWSWFWIHWWIHVNTRKIHWIHVLDKKPPQFR